MDEKGLEFWRKITSGAKKFLNEGGYLMFELGFGQSRDVAEIMDKTGSEGNKGIKKILRKILTLNLLAGDSCNIYRCGAEKFCLL